MDFLKKIVAFWGCYRFSAVCAAVIIVVMMQACEKTPEIPAKAISGTWSSISTISFFSESDSCTSGYHDYDSTAIAMQWEITYKVDNLVDISITSVNKGPTTKLVDCALSPYYDFPLVYHGVVGQADLVVERPYPTYDSAGNVNGTAYISVGDFTFTENSITGILVDQACDTLHCYGFRTGAFTLRK